MTAAEIFRGLSGVVWVALLFYLWRPARRAWSSQQEARGRDLIMSAVWLLCLNRLTFTVVGQFDARDQDALAFCHAFALLAGCYMLFMCSLARRRG